MRLGSSTAPHCCCSRGCEALTAARRARLSPGPAEERNELLLLLLRLSPRESNPGLCSPPWWCPHHPSALPDPPARFLPHLLICSVPFPARRPGLPLHSLTPSPPQSRVNPQPLFQPPPTAVPAPRASASPVLMAAWYLQHRNNNNNNNNDGNNGAKWSQQPPWCSRAKAKTDSKGNLEELA